jgi:hypothetical protein
MCSSSYNVSAAQSQCPARRRGSDQLPDLSVQTGRQSGALFRWVEAALFALPLTYQIVEVFKNDLAFYDVSKGTIRFPLSRPVPVKLIASIAKLRANETAERVKAKYSS